MVDATSAIIMPCTGRMSPGRARSVVYILHYTVVDRHGRQRQWGVLSLAYPEVRHHFTQRLLNLITPTAFDGLFVRLRSQSKPARRGDSVRIQRSGVPDIPASLWRGPAGGTIRHEHVAPTSRRLPHDLHHRTAH